MASYALFPGCAAKGVTKELYESTMAVIEKLNLDIKELNSFSCCGAGVLEEIKDVMDVAVNARNIALAEKEGRDIVTVCSTCLLVLRSAKYHLDNDDYMRDKVNRILSEAGLEYKGTADIKHFHWVLLDDIGEENLRNMVTNPLNGLRVYPYYGCHTIRPRKIIGYEDPENPQSLEKIITALGGQPVSGPRKIQCCGFHAYWPAPDMSMRLTGMNLKDAHELSADCIVTPCPLCHVNLDANQKTAVKLIGEKFQIPVLHLPQLVGIALGIEPDKLGLKRNIVPATSIV